MTIQIRVLCYSQVVEYLDLWWPFSHITVFLFSRVPRDDEIAPRQGAAINSGSSGGSSAMLAGWGSLRPKGSPAKRPFCAEALGNLTACMCWTGTAVSLTPDLVLTAG